MSVVPASETRPRTPGAASPSATGHRPVLLAEAVAALAPRPGGRYLDGTFGGGGHSREILRRSAPTGRVLALDADGAAVARAEALAAEPGIGPRLRAVRANFADLAEAARRADVVPLDGVLLDLGLSSFQLDAPERGFAFRLDGPLDMRFDPERGRPASDLVNGLSASELASLLFRFGEEPRARRIAAALVRERERAPIVSTARLAEVVGDAVGGRRGQATHPATRTFQALRIATNDELTALERSLDGALDVLAPGGRLVVIAFHSLEDRIVKRFIARERATCVCPPAVPICRCDQRPRLARVTRRAVRAGPEEIEANPRSRSALLRAVERLDDAALPATAAIAVGGRRDGGRA